MFTSCLQVSLKYSVINITSSRIYKKVFKKNLIFFFKNKSFTQLTVCLQNNPLHCKYIVAKFYFSVLERVQESLLRNNVKSLVRVFCNFFYNPKSTNSYVWNFGFLVGSNIHLIAVENYWGAMLYSTIWLWDLVRHNFLVGNLVSLQWLSFSVSVWLHLILCHRLSVAVKNL